MSRDYYPPLLIGAGSKYRRVTQSGKERVNSEEVQGHFKDRKKK